MQISFILSSLQLSGGVKVILEVTNRLIERGHIVNLIVPKGTVDPKVSSISPNAKVFESAVPFSPNLSAFDKCRLVYSLANTAPKSDFIISTHTPTTAAVLLAAKIQNKGIPFWYFQDYPDMFLPHTIESWLLRNALRWHKAAFAVSEYCKQVLLDSGINKPVVVVPDGLSNPQIFYPNNHDQIDKSFQGTIPLLFLGDPRPRKGLADFLAAAEIAFQQNNKIVLWIASKIDLIVSSTAPYQLFIRPNDQELAKLYRDCAIFVSASWIEGFGLPPLEAMACGAPVVMTDSKGVRDYAQNGENCILTPPKNPKALAEGILKIIQNPSLAEQLRRNGPPTASRFTWDATIDTIENSLKTWASNSRIDSP